jgi:hypothetical protein
MRNVFVWRRHGANNGDSSLSVGGAQALHTTSTAAGIETIRRTAAKETVDVQCSITC